MGIYLVNVQETSIVESSYLMEMDGETFDPKKAAGILASGKGFEQFDSTFKEIDHSTAEIGNAIRFTAKALSAFKASLKPMIEQEKSREKIAKEAKRDAAREAAEKKKAERDAKKATEAGTDAAAQLSIEELSEKV